MERIAMTTKEATRGAVLARVAEGKVTLMEAEKVLPTIPQIRLSTDKLPRHAPEDGNPASDEGHSGSSCPITIEQALSFEEAVRAVFEAARQV